MEPLKYFRVVRARSSQSHFRSKKSQNKSPTRQCNIASKNNKLLLPKKEKQLIIKPSESYPQSSIKIPYSNNYTENLPYLQSMEDSKSIEEELKEKALNIIKNNQKKQTLTISSQKITISKKNLTRIISQSLQQNNKLEKKLKQLKKERTKRQNLDKILKSVYDLIVQFDKIGMSNQDYNILFNQRQINRRVQNLKEFHISFQSQDDEIPYQSMLFIKKWNGFFIQYIESFCIRKNLHLQVEELTKQNKLLKENQKNINDKDAVIIQKKENAIMEYIQSIAELKQNNTYLSAKLAKLQKVYFNEKIDEDQNFKQIRDKYKQIDNIETKFHKKLEFLEQKQKEFQQSSQELSQLFYKMKVYFEEIIHNHKISAMHLLKQRDENKRKLEYHDLIMKKRKNDIKGLHHILEKIALSRSKILDIQKIIQNNQQLSQFADMFEQINSLFTQISNSIDRVLSIVSFA